MTKIYLECPGCIWTYSLQTLMGAGLAIGNAKVMIVLAVDSVESSRVAIYSHSLRGREVAALLFLLRSGGGCSGAKILTTGILTTSMRGDVRHSMIT